MLSGVKSEMVSIRVYGDAAYVTERAAVPGRPVNLISANLLLKQRGNWKWASFQATIVVSDAVKQ